MVVLSTKCAILNQQIVSQYGMEKVDNKWNHQYSSSQKLFKGFHCDSRVIKLPNYFSSYVHDMLAQIGHPKQH